MHLTLEMDKNKHLDLVNLTIYLASPYLFVIFLKFNELSFYGSAFISYHGTFKYIINSRHLGQLTEVRCVSFHDTSQSVWLWNSKNSSSNNTILFYRILLKINSNKYYLLTNSWGICISCSWKYTYVKSNING